VTEDRAVAAPEPEEEAQTVDVPNVPLEPAPDPLMAAFLRFRRKARRLSGRDVA